MNTSLPASTQLRCLVCHEPFDFVARDTALVLRHVAYGYDFVHDGQCLAAALERIFPEPGYDCAAFGQDPERRRVLEVARAEGWAAVVPNSPEQILAAQPVRFEPLQYWVLVEHQDGSQFVEGLIRDEEWLDEPGGAEFPEAWRGQRAALGYTSSSDRARPARLAEWSGLLQACRLQLAA